MAEKIKIALAGNPNSGKTTIFNRLTGAHYHVGNYPGVTVETRCGFRSCFGETLAITDLPGTYGLTALSAEELIARNFIINKKPDVVIDVIDASSLERHLYLAIQFIELETPLLLVLNMADMAKKKGIEFDIPLLSELLGVPIVVTTGTTGEGLDGLLETSVKIAHGELAISPKPFSYGKDLDREIELLTSVLDGYGESIFPDVPKRWAAIKLIEDDEEVLKVTDKIGAESEPIRDALKKIKTRLASKYSDPPEILIAEARYGIISGAATESVRHTVEIRHDFSDRLDSFFLNPILGIPIFLALMYAIFTITFRLGEPFTRILELFFRWASDGILKISPQGTENPLVSLAVDGIIGGVGGVLVFLPNIILLFIAIAFLEDTGYMARAAFITDRFMHR
ncbi:MAG: ferrous iron transporter B, partial [bacterium]